MEVLLELRDASSWRLASALAVAHPSLSTDKPAPPLSKWWKAVSTIEPGPLWCQCSSLRDQLASVKQVPQTRRHGCSRSRELFTHASTYRKSAKRSLNVPMTAGTSASAIATSL